MYEKVITYQADSASVKAAYTSGTMSERSFRKLSRAVLEFLRLHVTVAIPLGVNTIIEKGRNVTKAVEGDQPSVLRLHVMQAVSQE